MEPPATIRILIISGKEKRAVEYDGLGPLSIGRSPQSAIVIDDDRASRSHCEIRPGESPLEPFQIVDLKSRNGTLHNGQPVDRAALKPGDVIRVGSTGIVFGEGAPAADLAGPGGESGEPKSLSQNSSVGERDSLKAVPAERRGPGEEGRRGDMAENIVEEARRSITPPQPAEARRGFGIGSKPFDTRDLPLEVPAPSGGAPSPLPALARARVALLGAGLLVIAAITVLLLSPPPAPETSGPPASGQHVSTEAGPPGPDEDPSGQEESTGSPIAADRSDPETGGGAVAAGGPPPSPVPAAAPAPPPEEPLPLPEEEEQLWRIIHLERAGGSLLEAYADFLERYPAAARAQDARAVLSALEELRSGDADHLLWKVAASAQELAAEERFAEARALLAAGARIAEREGSAEAAARLEEERSRIEGRAADFLARRQAGVSEKNSSGRTSEAFREIAGLAPRLGDLPAFAQALLEFERAFSRVEPVHRPPLSPQAAERVTRARAAFAACRFRESQSEYLLALAADPLMAADDRAQLSRRAGEAAQVARMFEAAIPLLSEKKPEVSGIAPYPARVVAASAEAVEYDVFIPGTQPVRFQRRWEELRDPMKLRLFAAASLGGEGLIGLAHFAWEVGDDAAAEAALLRAHKWSERWEGQVQAALALRREVPVPEGGFVVYEDRFVDPVEKARREEEKKRAREREEAAERELALARRDGKLDRFLTIAASLREEGHFEMADRLYRAVVERFPAAGPGHEASTRVKDPVLRIRRIVEGEPPANPANRITFYFLAEGYPVKDDHQAAFDVAARRAWKTLIKEEPYREYEAYLDAAAVNVGSRESGVDRVPGDVLRDTALGGKVEWDAFTSDGRAVAAVLARIGKGRQHQSVVIGNDYAAIATGGGGVANIPKTSLGALAHEVGHALGGLHDEYDTPSGNDPQRKIVKARAGNVPARPRPPNLADGSQRAEVLRAVPWRHWIEAGEAAWWNRSKVEVFEGGGYSPVEVWRPQSGCMMRHGGMFCVVCMETMVKAIYRRVRPIDETSPVERELPHVAGAPLLLEATVMKPRSHYLEAKWTMDYAPPEAAVAAAPASAPASGGGGITRAVRPEPTGARGGAAAGAGPPPRISAEWHRRIAPGGRVVEGIRVRGEDLRSSGIYRFKLEVHDSTPWVLRDQEGLLREERTWTVRVVEGPAKGGVKGGVKATGARSG